MRLLSIFTVIELNHILLRFLSSVKAIYRATKFDDSHREIRKRKKMKLVYNELESSEGRIQNIYICVAVTVENEN